MLVYFKVGNYKSIKDPIVIDFNASGISEHPESNTFKAGGADLLRTIVLYGHNASGKSKILDALVLFRNWISDSVTQRNADLNYPEPFLLSSVTENKPCFFEAAFVIRNTRYRYGFEVDHEKVHNEWLLEMTSPNGKEHPVFLRVDGKFDVDLRRFGNAEGLEQRTRDIALFLSVAAQWNVGKAGEIVAWFNMIQVVSPFMTEQLYPRQTVAYFQKPKYRALIRELVNRADLGVDDIYLMESVDAVGTWDQPGPPTKPSEKLQSIHTTHLTYNENGEHEGFASFSLTESESQGTIKYFNLIGRLLYAIENNTVIIIDEFDAKLHTLLSKAILKLFNSSSSKSKAQLFVTSHDTALLDRRILRRDQIYFVAKDKFGASGVTALVEYKSRKESPYDKNYLEGKYGAIPFIEEFESLLPDVQ